MHAAEALVLSFEQIDVESAGGDVAVLAQLMARRQAILQEIASINPADMSPEIRASVRERIAQVLLRDQGVLERLRARHQDSGSARGRNSSMG